MRYAIVLIATFTLPLSLCVAAGDDAMLSVMPPTVETRDEGRRVVQDVNLSTIANTYTLRYDAIELADEPGRIAHAKWAPSLGYTPLGIAGPDDALWYNQGFFIWTFDDLNIQDYQAQFRVVREEGPDAMVEYVWDTPKAKVTARFAVTAGSDKLLFFGRYEPKEEISEVKLRLMAYPATFTQPWNRTLTTATRTLTEGTAEIDLSAERWLLLEDVTEGRPASGSAGLLLGDATAFSKVSGDGIGGYAEYVNLTLAAGRREFVLGLYELPSAPDYQATRDYFGRLGDSESDALAKLVQADLDQVLPPLPVDPDRRAAIERSDAEALQRPAELWRADPTPLEFPWAAQLSGGPVKVSLLCPRFKAYESMELARRLQMDVRHVYFDGDGALTDPNAWPYRGTTGIGPLPAGLLNRRAAAICADPEREVIMVSRINADVLGPRVRRAILEAVASGKGLLLTGGMGVLKGWPPELTATPDEGLLQSALASLPWQELPGLREGERGRTSAVPFKAFRYGQGRVVVQDVRLGAYSCLVPLNDATEGLEGATDRMLAFAGQVMLATAGRVPAATVVVPKPEKAPLAAVPGELAVSTTGQFSDALVRVQDDCDNVLALGPQDLAPGGAKIALPPLPAGRRYFVDVALRDQDGACVGYGGTVLDTTPARRLAEVTLAPSVRVHEVAVPRVDLAQGGMLACEARLLPGVESQLPEFRWEVSDCFGRVLARATTPGEPGEEGFFGRAELSLPRPVTVSHRLDIRVACGDRVVGVYRQPFTIPVPYPYDDFTVLMWSYPGGEPVVRAENRLCYELGSEMMDLCHMRGYTDVGAAREYAVASASGQRLVPYVSRIALDENSDHTLTPGPFDPAFIERERASMQVCSRQAAPYRPAAYTLGDENYLSRGRTEVDGSPETMVHFREWLQDRYQSIEALNAAWDSDYAGFADITEPMWIEEAVQQERSYAAWFDHRIFMDTAFADCHELFADVIRAEDPEAKVGWDGFLGYHWQAGYDFEKLTRNLELNQVYTIDFPQGEFVSSLKRPDALSGEWGNSVADREDGFTAICWHNLFKGHNSAWWWTSWGCDYIPFNPDLSVSNMGRWFFDAAAEIRSGPGKALVHARRDTSRVAILYSQTDLFASRLAGRLAEGSVFTQWLSNHKGLLNALHDVGVGYRHIGAAQLEQDPSCLEGYKVLFLPLATCLSEKQSEAIRGFVEAGGTVVADGRAGILSGNGMILPRRALDDLFGVAGPAGPEGFAAPTRAVEITWEGTTLKTSALDPGLRTTSGTAMGAAGEAPVLITNQVGRGMAVTLNVPFILFNEVRQQAEGDFVRGLLKGLLEAGGVAPYADLGDAECIKQSLFVDEGVQYLCLEQDILVRGLPTQDITVTLPEMAIVYDVREGKQIGDGWTDTWTTQISRGTPRLYALLSYEVAAVEATVPAAAAAGGTVPVEVAVQVDPGEAKFHVVHLAVYAPGSDRPHRQYSQNVECPGGKGQASIPFALNDTPGTWRLVARDVASGTTVDKTLELRAPEG